MGQSARARLCAEWCARQGLVLEDAYEKRSDDGKADSPLKICRMGGSVGLCSPRPAGSVLEEEEEDGDEERERDRSKTGTAPVRPVNATKAPLPQTVAALRPKEQVSLARL